jgi:hypothetical protein
MVDVFWKRRLSPDVVHVVYSKKSLVGLKMRKEKKELTCGPRDIDVNVSWDLFCHLPSSIVLVLPVTGGTDGSRQRVLTRRP